MYIPNNRDQIHEAKSYKTKVEINMASIIIGDFKIPFSVIESLDRDSVNIEYIEELNNTIN